MQTCRTVWRSQLCDTADDKSAAVDAVERKAGQMSGHNVDPQKYRAQNEKFTDKLRGMFEKYTGKKAPAKFSN